jgi:FkbM family methyltransferase
LQDLFVLEKLNFKTHGYFVEFGATNGKDLSNTWLLEKNFSWSGVLAEPGKNWHEELISNRESYISTKCVWKSSGELINFNQTVYPEFSTIGSLANFDGMEKSRETQEQYLVETISLQQLLHDAGAPKFIDYISIDTEGSEFEILSLFDFSEYQFGVLTVEHNHNHNETKIDQLLLDNGYVRVHRSISDFDGWYLNDSLVIERS